MLRASRCVWCYGTAESTWAVIGLNSVLLSELSIM